MHNFKENSLQINIEKKGNNYKMTWLGQSDALNPSVLLDPYLEILVCELKDAELDMDFLKLEYMNSSTVPSIVKFIKNLNSFNVKTCIIYDGNSKWQTASFKALATFSSFLKNITVKPVT